MGIDAKRVDTYTLYKYYTYISDIIKEELGIETYIVKFYYTKETHGNLDILLKIDHEFHNKNINLKDWIRDTFNPNVIQCNGGVYSWDFKQFQIDIIPMKSSNWEIAKVWHSFSPLGNLVGKTAHKFNLKFGFDGLAFAFRNFNGRLSQNIPISKNPEKIFTFLGYDYQRYLKGFSKEKDIFDFIINGKYFDKRNFQFENLNRIDRKRNIRRPDYNRFLEYVNNKKNLQSFYYKNKEDYIYYIDQYFPEANLINKLNELKRKDDRNKLLNSKFNGNLIMSKYPDLKGKELGDAIKQFKTVLDSEYENFILNNNLETILKKFNNIINT
jgi:hypothetical protein